MEHKIVRTVRPYIYAGIKSGAKTDSAHDVPQPSVSNAIAVLPFAECLVADEGNVDKASVHAHRTYFQWHGSERRGGLKCQSFFHESQSF